jgi:hypothetical protein
LPSRLELPNSVQRHVNTSASRGVPP